MNTMSLLPVVTVLSLASLGSAESRVVHPPVPVFEADEIVWFGAEGDLLLLVWGDGVITAWDPKESQVRSRSSGGVNFMFAHPDATFHSCSTSNTILLACVCGDWLTVNDIVASSQLLSQGFHEGLRPSGHGFWRDGAAFGCVFLKELALVDLRRQGVMDKFPLQDAEPIPRPVFLGEDGLVLVLHGRRMEGAEPAGKVRWTLALSPPCLDFEQAAFLGSGVHLLYSADWSMLFALDARNGTEAWRYKSEGDEHFLTASKDGTRQLFRRNNGYLIRTLPGKIETPIKDLDGLYDACFSADSAMIFFLPSPVASGVALDDCATTVSMRRPSRKFSAVDSGTGVIRGIIEVQR